jgi:hypothetical protein
MDLLHVGGINNWGQLEDLPEHDPKNPFISIGCSDYGSIAVRADGSYECWGYQDMARWYIHTTFDTCFNVIALGNDFAAGIDAHGSIMCWGIRRSMSSIRYSLRDPKNPYKAVVFIKSRIFALHTDGTLECRRSNNVRDFTPLNDPENPFTAITGNNFSNQFAALREDGSLAIWCLDN